MKPIEAIKMEYVPQPQNKGVSDEKELTIGTHVRRLLNKDEILNIATKKISVGKRRITDPYYSYNKYIVDKKINVPDGITLYKIRDSRTGKTYPHLYTEFQ